MKEFTQFLGEHWVEIVAALGVLIAGGFAIKIISNRQSGSSSRVDQRNAQAGGDIVGRDKIRH